MSPSKGRFCKTKKISTRYLATLYVGITILSWCKLSGRLNVSNYCFALTVPYLAMPGFLSDSLGSPSNQTSDDYHAIIKIICRHSLQNIAIKNAEKEENFDKKETKRDLVTRKKWFY